MHIYVGTFFIAAATLALEITLTRLLSVCTWYHLAFFAVATAMLGMTAGATTVYLRPQWFTREKLNGNTARACIGFALVIPFSLTLLCLTPLHYFRTVMTLLALVVVTLACALPFYFSGMAVTVVLTKYPRQIGKLYAGDLLGASLGCLLVLYGLEVMDAPSLILLCGSVGLVGALGFAWHGASRRLRCFAVVLFVAFTFSAFVNSSTLYGMRPVFIKGRIEVASDHLLERWNSFSRVAVYPLVVGRPQYWGESPLAPSEEKVHQYPMEIDGIAGTTVRRFASREDINHLRYDVTNVAYYLRPRGGACIIGVGGGRDIQSAILFGHEKITGIDVNPIFIDLLRKEFREFAGLADRPGVELVADEARSFLSRIDEKFSILQMSLIDTFAATGAGSFSLSENALYTIEAWKIFFNRLDDDGIFTVSRWYNPNNIGEIGRVVSLAVAALLESGVKDPARHLALVSNYRLATLLLSKEAFSEQDVLTLRNTCSQLKFDLPIVPSEPPRDEVLRRIVAARSLDQLHAAIKDRPLNYTPPTDNNPYFFNMLRPRDIGRFLWSEGRVFFGPEVESGVLSGNIVATLTLAGLIVALAFVAGLTIIVPLFQRAWSDQSHQAEGSRILWSAAAYFALIGAGFMFVEIALIQRLSVFLGHPVYALGILLFTIIASAGAGSLWSERLPLTQRPWLFLYPLIIAAAIITVRFLLPAVASVMTTAPMASRIIVSIVVIAPLGLLLGVCFPTGMRLVAMARAAETPWYWALNGIFGVLCSALTVAISICYGIATSFVVAAVCYLLLLLFLPAMYRASVNRPGTGQSDALFESTDHQVE